MKRSESGRISSLEDAARYLDGLINRERGSDYAYARLDLRPIAALVDALGRPQDRLSIVHVAGSKGKGSTCLLVEALLGALGERVGTFTSPHLVSWLERFRIAGRDVAAATLAAAVERVRPAVDALRDGPPETLPSFFDATTAVALLLFAEARVDRAILEVGLGGRLDSTNVVRPAVTCITSIELEHTDKLGPTEARIAGEKAGILKPGVPAVLGRLGRDAERVIRARAAEVGAPVFARGEHFEVFVEQDGVGATGQTIRFESSGWAPIRASLPVLGDAAVSNAALALACVRALDVHGEAAIRRAAGSGLAAAKLPGRIEILSHDPAVVIDAAHTARSAQVLAEVLGKLAPSGCALLMSISSDKDVDAVLAALLPRATRIWLTRADPQRSLDPGRLAERVRQQRSELPIEVVEDPIVAARAARAALGPGERMCAVGSVYLAGAARQALANPGPKAEAPELAPRTIVRREG
ncbi:MAG: folylpolyglutamate synthase/dihydrofolate synthase family protein [Myxococcota bacterium]